MENTAYLLLPLSGPHGIAAVGVSASDALKIVEDLERAAASPKHPEVAVASEIRVIPYDDLPVDHATALMLCPSLPVPATEMPVSLPAPQPAIRRAAAWGVSWHDLADAFSTQAIGERDVLIAGCISARPGDDVTLLFQRLAAMDAAAAISLAGYKYKRLDVIDLPPLGCGSIGPRCLEPLLIHADREIREKAIGMLGRFKP
jgi:hypothetical protein